MTEITSETILTKDDKIKHYYIWLPIDLVEEIDKVRKLRKWDDPDTFKTRNHVIYVALKKFLNGNI